MLRPFAEPGGDALDVVLPVARGFPQPLAAAYRTRLAPTVAALVAADRLRPAFVFEDAEVLRLDDDALLADPALRGRRPDAGVGRQRQRAGRLRRPPGPGRRRR